MLPSGPSRLSALAEQDLEEIWSCVAEDASPATTARLIDAIVDRLELLAEQPRMGRLRSECGPGASGQERVLVVGLPELDLVVLQLLPRESERIVCSPELFGAFNVIGDVVPQEELVPRLVEGRFAGFLGSLTEERGYENAHQPTAASPAGCPPRPGLEGSGA